MKRTRSPAGVGAPDVSDADPDKKQRTTINDPPIFPGAISPQPMNHDYSNTDLTNLESKTTVTDEDSAASDPELSFLDEEESESDREDVPYLCERCRKLDFDSLFSRQRIPEGGDPILWFYSEHKTFDDERCSFCQAMQFIHPSLDKLSEREKRRYSLVVATAQGKKGWSRQPNFGVPQDRICLTFGYHPEGPSLERQIFRWTKQAAKSSDSGRFEHKWVGYLAEKRTIEEDSNALPAASIKPRVNFGMIKNALKECREKHKECGTKEFGYMQKIPGMRLIDCRTRTVVHAPEADVPYAALSYVWGDSGEAKFGYGSVVDDSLYKLPDTLPNTISDAIMVTQKLKIRYLWIDRYCIRQVARTKKEKDEKHGQIARMHRIYGGASITIIAAAGKGPDHGLPGIRTKRRSPTVRLPNRTLFATLPDPKLLLDASVWSTRGWTFQEGLLARRLLVFTEQQVYFQCREAGEPEAWEECHEEDMSEPFDSIQRTALYPNFTLGDHWGPSVWPRISDYVRRSMRDSQDILNGILGVLTHYERISNLRHVAGLPVFPWNTERRVWSPEPDAICWPWKLADALFWLCNEPGERRAGFPSWSWTGWTCKGFERNQRIHQASWETFKTWSISIEDTTNESNDQSDLDALLEGWHDLSQVLFLRVTAPSLEAEIIPIDGIPDEQRFWNEIIQWNDDAFDNNEKSLGVRYPGDEEVSFINLTDSNWLKSPVPIGKIQCFAIVTDDDLPDTPDYHLEGRRAIALLVIEKEDGFEKIGVSRIDRQKLRRTGTVVREFRLM